MSELRPCPQRFYRKELPGQFNRALDAQRALGEAGRRVYDAMRAANATIRVDVEGEGGGTFFLNIEAGRMSAGSEAAHPPFLTLLQDRRGFERMAGEAGDSAPALLGGLAGVGGELRLTRARIERLRALESLVLFEVTGDAGFALRSHFGSAPPPAAPSVSIRLDEQAYRELRSGALDAQTAFLEHRIQVTGNLETAFELALAAAGAAD